MSNPSTTLPPGAPTAGAAWQPDETTLKQRVHQVVTREEWLARGLIALTGLWLIVTVALPLYQIVYRSLSDKDGNFVGLANYQTYFETPALFNSFFNSLFVALSSTAISVVLGFIFAYALTRSAMPGKPFFRIIAMLPLYAPSLVHAIALIYLFGNQGLITRGFFGLLPGYDIDLYGANGIIIGLVLFCFPQAFLILSVALALTDARLYEAARALRTPPLRSFWTITLPSVKYGLISAAFVCFTLAFTDFGVPKVVGGDYNVLATDVYKQVIGQQNFVMGSTVSILLLVPTVIAFIIDRLAQGRQVALLSARAVPLQPAPNRLLDWSLLGFCLLVCFGILATMGTALYASLADVWPYNLALSLRHYDFSRVGGGGYGAYWNSVRMAIYTAFFGTAIVFASAYLTEKMRRLNWARSLIYFASMLPVALPGLVIGLAYIFFFNIPGWELGAFYLPNPFNAIYATMAILVIANIIHFYTVGFLTATTALKQLDAEFETVSESMAVPFFKTFWRVTVPVCLPAILEIAMYYFVNAMVTVSAVIFLYSPSLQLASVAVVNMDDAGDTPAAAAMSMLIVGTSIGVRVLYGLATWGIQKRTQAWKRR